MTPISARLGPISHVEFDGLAGSSAAFFFRIHLTMGSSHLVSCPVLVAYVFYLKPIALLSVTQAI